MIVTRIAFEPYRFYVASDSNPDEPYLVDLEEYDGNGECGCLGFAKHFRNKLENGAKAKNPEDLKCKHIIRAMVFVAQTTILADRIEKNAKKKA